MRLSSGEIGRHKPASGVHLYPGQPTIVFVTVTAEHRQTWVAQASVHELLVSAWRDANTWLVGYYLLMPDHVHLFVAPHDIDVPLNRWMSYWKRLFTQRAASPAWTWQPLHWDTRLRRTESYQEKWLYIRENPVRNGLVAAPEQWPYQGMLNALWW